MRLLDFLFPPRVDEAALRALSDDAFFALASPRLISATRPETVALLPFKEPPVRAAVHEAKYHGSARALTLLATVLADFLRERDEGFRSCIVVPVPLGALRRKERGMNQAEEIARRAAHEFGGTVDAGLLLRVRETASQVSLPRHKREENMRSAFKAARAANPALSYVLVDDVVTTGATLQAAIDALTEAGASHIIPIALAH